MPALRGSRVVPQDAMRGGGRGSTGAHSHWFQHSLIVVETALAVVLLTCGGLLLRTYHHLRHRDVGMRSERLLTFETPVFRFGAFAVLALMLASLGIYGVLSYAVSQRSNEIGVRMALGATAAEILRSVTPQGLSFTALGLVVALAAAGAASRVLTTTLLYGYRPDYFSTAAAVSIILTFVAAFACLVPARRASRTDPMTAPRRE